MKLLQRLLPAVLTIFFFGGLGLLLSAGFLHFYKLSDTVSIILACSGVVLHIAGILTVFTVAGLSRRMD